MIIRNQPTEYSLNFYELVELSFVLIIYEAEICKDDEYLLEGNNKTVLFKHQVVNLKVRYDGF